MEVAEATMIAINNHKMVAHCDKWSGALMFDKIKGGIYFCNEDEKTYYEKWNSESESFNLIEWRCGGLDGLNLEIFYDDEAGYS